MKMWDVLMKEIRIYVAVFGEHPELVPEVKGQIPLPFDIEQETDSKEVRSCEVDNICMLLYISLHMT